jgi:hypothetical protein
MVALAPIGDKLFFVAFVDREPARRMMTTATRSSKAETSTAAGFNPA